MVTDAIVVDLAANEVRQRVADQRRRVGIRNQLDALKAIWHAAGKPPRDGFLIGSEYADAEDLGINKGAMQTGIDAQTPLHQRRVKRHGAERIGSHTDRVADCINGGDDGDTGREARESMTQRKGIEVRERVRHARLNWLTYTRMHSLVCRTQALIMKPSIPLLAVMSITAALASANVAAQIKIGAMVSATGPTSAIGIPQRNTVSLLPASVAGQTIEYITLDDGGDTTRAVQNVKQLIQQHKVDAIIGPSTTPNALAILPIIAEAKVPLVSTVGSQAVVEPQDATKRWVFKTTQNDDLIAEALVSHMVRAKVKRVGYIGFNDPFGEGFLKLLPGLLTKNKIELVATEKYARTDQSVTGQALKLIAAKPDAVFIAAVGGPAVLPQATLRDQGYKGFIYQTHAIATQDFIKIGGAKVEGTVLAAGGMLVFDEMSDANPIKNVTARYIRAYEKVYGNRPATFGANTYDSGILLQYAIPDALKKGAPGTEAFRTALRDSLEAQKEIVGCQGIFNITPANHNGMDKRARDLITIKDGKFRLLGESKVAL